MTHKNLMIERGIKFWQKLPPSWRFSLVYVTLMRVLYTLWSLVFLSSFPLIVQNQEILGEPLVTVFHLQTSRSYVYSRYLETDLLFFQKYDSAHLVDTKTGSVWQVTNGTSVSGFYEGSSLSPAHITTEELFPYHGVAPHSSPWIAIWQRFDANWYLLISQNGYGSTPGDVHFPPLYPALINLVNLVIPSGIISALLISQIALYLTVKLLYDVFTEWGGGKVAQKSLFFLLIFPTSFFLFSAYTEALFITFAVLCLESIRKMKWHWAGFWIFCAILVRLQGVGLILPLAWGILQTRFRDSRLIDVFFAGLGPAIGMGVYLYIRAASDDPSVIPFTETNLHARIVPPWENVRYSIEYIVGGLAGYIDILNLVVLVLFSVLLLVHWKKFPIEYALFSLASIVIMTMRLVDTQPLNSMIRYLLTVFPIFYVFGILASNSWINRFLFVVFLSLNLFLSAQFFLWGWVG